jgi:hypothetical protein
MGRLIEELYQISVGIFNYKILFFGSFIFPTWGTAI